MLITKNLVDQSLAQQSLVGKKLLDPLKTFSLENKVPVHILENSNISNSPEVHQHEADLWICISGQAKFITGGQLINPRSSTDPRELTGDYIEGGEEQVLDAGDLLYIPAGVPHSHSASGVARLYIIKIPEQL